MIAFSIGHVHLLPGGAGARGIFAVVLALLAVYACRLLYRTIVIARAGTSAARDDGEVEGVSVIITARDSVAALEENLPAFLEQEHDEGKYEVIVVDDGSVDGTSEFLARTREECPLLRCTRVYPGTKFRFTKKLAINIGVLAARHDVLLFSEAGCRPATRSWARAMGSCFDGETAVVVGYSNFKDGKCRFAWRRHARFARFLEVLLHVGQRAPLLGDGCNMGYRKSCYMQARGFAGDTQSYAGYDHDMARVLSARGKVKACVSPGSFMLVDDRDEERVTGDTSRYFACKSRWPLALRLREGMDAAARAGIYLLSLSLVLTGVLPAYALLPAVVVFVLDVASARFLARRFHQQGLLLASLVAHAAGFAYRWYWHGYSFFNPGKWR
ncbi:MAG: glycosyltransferase [Odoribacteraceae bacterium]|jgi:glycosyltransferase involved in cell wall biosynthesis|nr:glycosyltransferase [Odoribacteraceae bacterium]